MMGDEIRQHAALCERRVAQIRAIMDTDEVTARQVLDAFRENVVRVDVYPLSDYTASRMVEWYRRRLATEPRRF